MKRTGSWLVAAGAAVGLTGVAHADVSSTITATSNYDFRGSTQTSGDPALQASLDWSHESGAYLGAWASNVDFGPGTDSDIEVDVYGGYKFTTGEVSWDLGAIYYTYHPGGDDVDYWEVYAGLGYKAFGAKLWVAGDYGNTGDDAWYLEGNYTVALPQDFGLALHAGYSGGDYWKPDEYFDYSIGVTKNVGKFSLALKYIDGSDFAPGDYDKDLPFSFADKVVFSVATTLPWK